MNIILIVTKKDTLINIFNSIYNFIVPSTATDIVVFNTYNDQTTAEDLNRYVIRALSIYNKICNQVVFTYRDILEIDNKFILKNAIEEFNNNMENKTGKKIFVKLIDNK
jgi:hypothetical protein